MTIKIDVEEVVTKTTAFKGAQLCTEHGAWVHATPGGQEDGKPIVDLSVTPKWSAKALRELAEFATEMADVLDEVKPVAEKPKDTSKVGKAFSLHMPNNDEMREKIVRIEPASTYVDLFITHPNNPTWDYGGTFTPSTLRDLRDRLTEFLGD